MSFFNFCPKKLGKNSKKRLTYGEVYVKLISALIDLGVNFLRRLIFMRTKITLACTECKQRNYNMTKDKKTHPDRMETKKYCKFCKSHTLHKETK